jgi:O-antigen ligase
LHANPLASGKFILVLGCMLAAGLIRTDREQTRFRNVATWSLFVIVAFALIATESKSTILAFLISLLVMTLVTFRTETITVRSAISAAKVGIAFLAAIVLWALVLAPPIKHHAATAWLGSSNIAQRADLNELRPDLNELAGLPRDFRPSKTRLPVPAEPATSGLLSQFLSEFRVGKSYRLQARTEDLDSPLKSRLWDQTETERHCGVSCTGQRDLLWNAGLKVLREHWLMGIGFGGWKRVLNEKLGFPFDHPHLGLVEVWGEFGILGLAMYLTLVLFLIVRARHAIQAKAAGFEKWFLIGTSMAALALLSNELFDTSKFFSVSPHAIWIWALLALQERYLRQPLTWSASVRWLSFLADKIKHPQSAASPIRSSP